MNPRLRRLQADYTQVRELYSGHPRVEIEPVGSRLPPETYRIRYRLDGLRLEGERPGNLETDRVRVASADEHEVELLLPRRYPAEKPYAAPKSPIFHPNVREYYCLVDDENWAPSTRLVDLIAKIGDMIQYRDYNLASPLDPLAARWTLTQEGTGRFPVGNVGLGVEEISMGTTGGDSDFDVLVHSADPSE
ncbi:MAG: ubiquitin-conjugating enzyme E2 [Solirubrobacterales bacterium]|nr:ubiquitin-conjugating enzyme E2 [Solirubrobacterales bacterium]